MSLTAGPKGPFKRQRNQPRQQSQWIRLSFHYSAGAYHDGERKRRPGQFSNLSGQRKYARAHHHPGAYPNRQKPKEVCCLVEGKKYVADFRGRSAPHFVGE